MKRFSPVSGVYGSMKVPIWTSLSVIQEKMFDPEGSLRPMYLSYIDLPHFYDHNEFGYDFINALHESKDIDIFSLESVQILVDSQMDHWYRIN